MPIVPRLTLAVLCQHVEYDNQGQPYSLIEPLHAVQKPPEDPWPFVPAELILYAQLEDAVGTFNFTAQIRNESDIIIGQTTRSTRITFPGNTNRHVAAEFVFTLPGLEFPEPGVYEFLVMCNHKPLPLHGVEPAARLRVLD